MRGEKEESDHNYFTRTTSDEYEGLYQLDVLGVEDRKEFDQDEVRKEFLENVSRKQTGRYVVKIPWIEDRIPQKTNEAQSRVRLNSLFRRMSRSVKESYDAIIKEQLDMGIIEEAPTQPTGSRTFYMPHKPVIRDNATRTKVRMVFDASAKPSPEAFSVNKCMNPGPQTQPLLWDILIRSRVAPVCVAGDIKKAFLQLELHTEDRDAFRFLYRNEDGVETHYRFCRLPFGGESSPFILGCILECHIETVSGDENVKEQLKLNAYVDNVMGLVANEHQGKQFREEAVKIMEKGKFPLTKWESNLKLLNDDDQKKVTTKLLGVPWNKEKDTYCVDMEIKNSTIITKQTMLKTVASFYDPLGIMAPVLIEGKHLYRLAVDEKKGWDEEVSNELQVKWKKWIYGLKTAEVPRGIAPYLEDVTAVILHHLMDASKKAVSAETIAIVVQPSGKTQGLLSSKARLAKRGLSMPIQELVSCQIGANLATNTSNALKGLPLKENNCWTDSKVALCWLTKPFKNWKTFVANRVVRLKKLPDHGISLGGMY